MIFCFQWYNFLTMQKSISCDELSQPNKCFAPSITMGSVRRIINVDIEEYVPFWSILLYCMTYYQAKFESGTGKIIA